MPSVAIIDSGVGALSIYQEINKLLPNQQCVVVADNQAFPYGNKSQADLKNRVVSLARRVVDRYSPGLLVIACNTASTIALPALRDILNLPIVGVVPAIKPAAKLSQHKIIGILATPATIRRDYTDDLIEEFASDCEVIRVGSSRLVEIAEDKIAGAKIDLKEIELEVKAMLDVECLDVIVLSCTHFPLLNNEISDIFEANNHPITLIDSGSGVARRIRDLVENMALPGTGDDYDAVQDEAGHASFAVFTQSPDKSADYLRTLQNMGLCRVEVLD